MIKFENVAKSYNHGVVALSDINIDINNGEFIFIKGPSGSGKSTLLKLLLKEEVPSEGKIIVDGRDLATIREKDIPYLRRKMGCVFQDFRLLYDRTVYENIVFALRVIEASDREIKNEVAHVLELVGLTGQEDKYPNQLSGGEQQRVGLARALVTRPPIVIADEPTGNLDNETADEIMKILYEVNAKGTTVLMVTHSEDIVKKGSKRVITLSNGHVVSDTRGGVGYGD